MASRTDFTDEEWEAISDAPVLAGFMVITASRGGTFRETFSMSKAWVEQRQHHGESELLDAIVAEKPKIDKEDRPSSVELREKGIRMLGEGARVIREKAPDELDAYTTFVTGLARRVAEAHKEHGEEVSEEERAVLAEIADALGT